MFILNLLLFPLQVGYQCLLRGKVKDAHRYYKTATKLDETSVIALSGIIACQLREGQLEVAKEQLDFLQEVQQSVTNRSEILYMSAVLGRQTGKATAEVVVKACSFRQFYYDASVLSPILGSDAP